MTPSHEGGRVRTALSLPPSLASEISRVDAMDTAAVRAELVQGFRLTVAGLLRMAACVRVLEGRGEDLSDLEFGLLAYVRRIAHGQVLPEVVAKFVGHPLLIQRVVALPLPDQERLGRGDCIELVIRSAEGYDKRRVDPAKMTGEQVRQVFTPDGIRDEAAQKLFLESRSVSTKKPLPRKGKVRPDPERGGILVNRTFVSQVDILAALAELSPNPAVPDDGAEGTHQALPVLLTGSEHRALKILAARQGVSMNDLARRALRAYGLLRKEADTS